MHIHLKLPGSYSIIDETILRYNRVMERHFIIYRRKHMTTIIVVVVVALVFFVAVCVAAFMVWKRESEMRTDNIRAIEQNLEKLANEISPDLQGSDGVFGNHQAKGQSISYSESSISEIKPMRPGRKRNYDPFGWVRDDDSINCEEDFPEPEPDDYEVRSPEFKQESPEFEQEQQEAEPEPPETEPEQIEPEPDIERQIDSISLDFIDDLDYQESEENEENEGIVLHRQQMGYDTGRSGKRYTASELETLIRE